MPERVQLEAKFQLKLESLNFPILLTCKKTKLFRQSLLVLSNLVDASIEASSNVQSRLHLLCYLVKQRNQERRNYTLSGISARCGMASASVRSH